MTFDLGLRERRENWARKAIPDEDTRINISRKTSVCVRNSILVLLEHVCIDEAVQTICTTFNREGIKINYYNYCLMNTYCGPSTMLSSLAAKSQWHCEIVVSNLLSHLFDERLKYRKIQLFAQGSCVATTKLL